MFMVVGSRLSCLAATTPGERWVCAIARAPSGRPGPRTDTFPSRREGPSWVDSPSGVKRPAFRERHPGDGIEFPRTSAHQTIVQEAPFTHDFSQPPGRSREHYRETRAWHRPPVPRLHFSIRVTALTK